MKELEVSLNCSFCGNEHKQSIPMPDGWDSRYRSVSDERAFCPQHAIIASFADSQCPGCVGGWGDCPLFSAFAYSGRTDMAEADYLSLTKGVCPKRVNGTMMFSQGKMESIDLRGKTDSEAGTALAAAIKEYIALYAQPEPR